MIGENLKVTDLFLIFTKLIGTKFYAPREVMLTFHLIDTFLKLIVY